MLFKLSNLNSNLALTLGYLNPALNNSALDHTILVFNYFGFPTQCKHGFRLTSRTHSVIIANTTSSRRRLEFGVSQGSLPGPLLFTLYTAPFQAIISSHNPPRLYFLCTILNYTVDPIEQRPTLNTVQKCICEVIK